MTDLAVYASDATKLDLEEFRNRHGAAFFVRCQDETDIDPAAWQTTVAMMPMLAGQWEEQPSSPTLVFPVRKQGRGEGAIILGRASDCHIMIAHPSVSRAHAFASWVEDRLQITDNQSENGTFVSRKQLPPGQPRILRPGQVIQLGSVPLLYLPAARFVQFLATESGFRGNQVESAGGAHGVRAVRP